MTRFGPCLGRREERVGGFHSLSHAGFPGLCFTLHGQALGRGPWGSQRPSVMGSVSGSRLWLTLTGNTISLDQWGSCARPPTSHWGPEQCWVLTGCHLRAPDTLLGAEGGASASWKNMVSERSGVTPPAPEEENLSRFGATLS